MAIRPYQGRAYGYGSSRAADIMRQSGAVQADLAQRGGYYAAQMASAVGQGVGQFLGDLGRYQYEAPEREARELRLKEMKSASARKGRLEGLNRMAADAGLDAEGTATLFEREGFRDEASAVRDQDHKQFIQATQREATGYEMASRKLDQARNLYVPVATARTPKEKAAAWSEVRPKMQEALKGSPYAEALPEQWTPDLDQQVLEVGQKLSDVVRLRKEAAAEAHQLAQEGKKDTLAALGWLGKSLATVDTPEEYATARRVAKRLGANDEALADVGLGEEFDPAAVQRARDMLATKEKTGTHVVGRYLVDDAGKVLFNAPRDPSGAEGGGITPSARAAAIRWRNAQQQDADAEYQKAITPRPETTTSPAYTPTSADIEAAKERRDRRLRQIDLDFKEQVGDLSTGPAPTGAGSLLDLGRPQGNMSVAGPGDLPVPGASRGPASQTPPPQRAKVVTVDELTRIAARRGTSVAQERERAIASGYVVR